MGDAAEPKNDDLSLAEIIKKKTPEGAKKIQNRKKEILKSYAETKTPSANAPLLNKMLRVSAQQCLIPFQVSTTSVMVVLFEIPDSLTAT